MRRVGLVLAIVLTFGGLNAQADAAGRGHQLQHFGGAVLVNYGPHKSSAAFEARVSTDAPGIDVSGDTAKSCTTGLPIKICVWYSANPMAVDSNAPPAGYVDDVVATLQKVESTYVTSGYLPVEPSQDPGAGYGGTMNVYLHDLGNTGMYGFIAPDSGSGQVSTAGHDRAAYMVIDNDFSANQYPDANGFPGCSQNCSLDIMRVTVAHEFFHATQFAYDALSADRWFMEATATWAETQVFPTLHDNWLYFAVPDGTLTKPSVPLDDNSGSASTMAFYQNFAWIQYVGHNFGSTYGSMPAVILNSWRYSSARTGYPPYFSVSAMARAIAGAGSTLPAGWLAFSTGNRHHSLGASYPISRTTWSRAITTRNLSPIKAAGSVTHLSSQTFVLTPQRLPSSERLHLAIRVTNQSGTVAGVTLYFRTGAVRTYPMSFSHGFAASNLTFTDAAVLKVEFTIGNASSRYAHCWTETTNFACHGGTPTVNRVDFSWIGTPYHV